METEFDAAIAQLSHLNTIRERFLIRAELLPADLALVGLCNELREAAYLAVELCRLHAQPAAFPLARTVFEATQRVIVLATEEDYLSVGVRAWLYDLRKQRKVAAFARGQDTAQKWFEDQVHEIQRIWDKYDSQAKKTIDRENAQLDALATGRRPDNFMGQDLGKLVEARYPKLAGPLGKSAAELGKLNFGIYTALSRESHAHLRVDPAALRIS